MESEIIPRLLTSASRRMLVISPEKGKRTEEREYRAKRNYHIRIYKIIKWQKKVEMYWQLFNPHIRHDY